MPTSRSPSRTTDAARGTRSSRRGPGNLSDESGSGRGSRPPSPARFWWAVGAVACLTLLGVVLSALPAAVLARFLPPRVALADLSGSIWHGSAGRIALDGRDAGALEWKLHPQALLHLALQADVHWVKGSFVIDAALTADRRSLTLQDARGGGALADLADLGLAPGWRGNVQLHVEELTSDYARVSSAVGELSIAGIASPQVAEGVDLGSYQLVLPRGALDAGGNIDGRLTDTGGPLEVRASIHYSPADRTGLLSGTLRERPGAPPELHAQLENLAQMKPRDAQGRIPADLEFRF